MALASHSFCSLVGVLFLWEQLKLKAFTGMGFIVYGCENFSGLLLIKNKKTGSSYIKTPEGKEMYAA
jgi:hypothetical protein